MSKKKMKEANYIKKQQPGSGQSRVAAILLTVDLKISDIQTTEQKRAISFALWSPSPSRRDSM